MFHSSVCGARKFVWWGLSPAKPRVATELACGDGTKPCQIHQNKSNTFSILFLLKWLSMTANVSIPLNKGDFPETRMPPGWLWFTPLAVQTYNLSSKLTTQTHQLHYPLQECHFPTQLHHAEKQQLYWNWAMLPFQRYSLQPPKCNVDNAT